MYSKIIEHISRDIRLTEDETAVFLSRLSSRNIKKKEFLYRPGDKVHSEFYVVKGCLKAYYQDPSGQDHIIQFAVEDWWISDFEAFFNQQPANLFVDAIEDSELLELERNTLERLYREIPKLERFFRIKTTNAFVALRARILSSLQKSGRERYLEFCENYPSIEKRVPNYYIANYLGLKPESLSRIRRELQ